MKMLGWLKDRSKKKDFSSKCCSDLSHYGKPLYALPWHTAAAAAESLQSCPTLCDPIDGCPPGSRPWDSPGKNTGVGCHFLLQCMKVKSESEVAQSCLILSDPMTAAYQASPSMGFSRQEYWSGVPSPSLPLHYLQVNQVIWWGLHKYKVLESELTEMGPNGR